VARDAYIETQTLRKLAVHFKGQLAPGALRQVRAELRHRRDEEMKRFGRKQTAKVVGKILHRELKTFERLKVKGRGWKTIGPAVRATYRAGRRAFRTVSSDPSPENFHEWRKRAKDLWYHVRLLHPVWPEQMEAMANELDELCQALGDCHDLFVLRQDVEQLESGQASEVEMLKGLINERGAELQTAALVLGARLYAEKPAKFCTRLTRYWRAWRREKKPLVQPRMVGA
jgi:CHAD domain-containing protein